MIQTEASAFCNKSYLMVIVFAILQLAPCYSWKIHSRSQNTIGSLLHEATEEI